MTAIGLLLLIPVVMWIGQTALLRACGMPVRWRIDADNAPRVVRTGGRVVTQASLVGVLAVYPMLIGESPVAYPFSFLSENPVLNDSIGNTDLVAFFDDGTLSAFGTLSNEQQTSGSATVFSRMIGDRTLTFELTDTGITDAETGSIWNLVGMAVSGDLKGTQLAPVVHASHFWFAWAVFKPETEVRDSIEALTPLTRFGTAGGSY